MNKVFLSHSSKDKALYIRTVAEKLGKENIEYDEWTFEEGEETALEIQKRIDSSDLFAFFISDDSLKSGWVEKEIDRAILQLTSGNIKKIFPIIIDASITHEDLRIPKCLRDNYNLKYISKPTVAVRRIASKLRELHWQNDPVSEQRRNIFVGRNNLLRDFENRIDDIDLPKPIVIIASGITKIGRSSFLRNALNKANLTAHSYFPLKITLDRTDSIEDLILKLVDTGITSIDNHQLLNMLKKSMVEKQSLLHKILKDIQEAKEIIFVDDHGCLIAHNRDVAAWLLSTIESNLENRPTLCISAKYRVNQSQIRKNNKIYSIDIPELAPTERNGLLRRLLELHGLHLSPDDFNFFSSQLHGFPEEAHFCADLILDYGVLNAKKESHQLTEFNSERASVLLRKYDSNHTVMEFIYFLSRFEFISVDFIFEIVDEESYQPILNELVTHLICDYIGGDHEFVRLNDTIRDLIQRNRLELSESYRTKLNRHVTSFIKDTDKFERDASDFLFSVKEAIVRGDKIDERYLIPSHILRTIRELYFSKENLKRVVALADMLLEKEEYLDTKVRDDVRYYLCLSLARQKDKRVLQEAHKIVGPEHDFLLGYYYRLCGRHSDAIDRLTRVIDTPYIAARAKRELVQVYLYIEEYEKALEMARENYQANKGNQYPIQSYLHCLLNSEDSAKHITEIEALIEELGQIGSVQSQEMMFIAKGLFEAKLNNNKSKSYNFFDDAIGLDPRALYPHLAKFDVALKFKDTEMMRETLDRIELLSESKTFSKNTLIKNRAFYLASIGECKKAIHLLDTGLDNYPRETIEKFKEKIYSMFPACITSN